MTSKDKEYLEQVWGITITSELEDDDRACQGLINALSYYDIYAD